jgi:hypothetical protein
VARDFTKVEYNRALAQAAHSKKPFGAVIDLFNARLSAPLVSNCSRHALMAIRTSSCSMLKPR